MILVVAALVACDDAAPTTVLVAPPEPPVQVGVVDPGECAEAASYTVLAAEEQDDGALLGSRLVPPATPFEVTQVEVWLLDTYSGLVGADDFICDAHAPQRLFLFVTELDAPFPEADGPDHIEFFPSLAADAFVRHRRLAFDPEITLEEGQVLWVMWELQVDPLRRSCTFTCDGGQVPGVDFFYGEHAGGYGWTALPAYGANLPVAMQGHVR